MRNPTAWRVTVTVTSSTGMLSDKPSLTPSKGVSSTFRRSRFTVVLLGFTIMGHLAAPLSLTSYRSGVRLAFYSLLKDSKLTTNNKYEVFGLLIGTVNSNLRFHGKNCRDFSTGK